MSQSGIDMAGLAPPSSFPAFGNEMRSSQFRFDPDLTPINNGSYGAVPWFVREYQQSLQTTTDADADGWFREEYDTGLPTKWRQTLETVCKFIGTSYDNTVFVENATTGMNCAVNCIPLGPGDALLTSSVTYNAIKQACIKRARDTGAKLLTIDLPDKRKDAVVKAYADFFRAHPNVKVILLDHITSNTAWIMPVKELIELCRANNILVCVDGAHVPGQLQVNIEELEPDFYAGNFHKWFFTPHGAAFLWIHPKHRAMVHPVVTSHKYNTTLHGAFYMQGTREFISQCCVPKAIEFIDKVGGLSAIHEYNSRLSNEARNMLVKSWNTERYPIQEQDEAPFMKIIRMPPFRIDGTSLNRLDGERLVDLIYAKSKIRTKIVLESGAFWIRISTSIYNTMEDYVKLKDVICSLAGIAAIV